MSKVIEKIGPDFKVADMSIAAWGHKEMRIAETEMPGLMACLLYTSPSPRD